MKRARSGRYLRRFVVNSEKVYKEQKQKISSSDSQVGPVKFSPCSNTFMQRNPANHNDKKMLK